jgi:hypothetical protein
MEHDIIYYESKINELEKQINVTIIPLFFSRVENFNSPSFSDQNQNNSKHFNLSWNLLRQKVLFFLSPTNIWHAKRQTLKTACLIKKFSEAPPLPLRFWQKSRKGGGEGKYL